MALDPVAVVALADAAVPSKKMAPSKGGGGILDMRDTTPVRAMPIPFSSAVDLGPEGAATRGRDGRGRSM
jgi:hypothetical protein